jgi:long-subunit fatty acid transport protein
MTRTRIILLAALLPVVVFMPAMSRAALFEQLATCPTGADMGNARTAYPPGAMAVLYNPAALANIPGTRFDNAIGYLDWTREISLKQAIDRRPANRGPRSAAGSTRVSTPWTAPRTRRRAETSSSPTSTFPYHT